MVGVILKATDGSFQKGTTFCRSLYVKKVMKLLAFIFEQPSYFTVRIQGEGVYGRFKRYIDISLLKLIIAFLKS